MFSAQEVIEVCLTSLLANTRVKDCDWSLVDLPVNDFSITAHCAPFVSHQSDEPRTLCRQSERDRDHRILWFCNNVPILCMEFGNTPERNQGRAASMPPFSADWRAPLPESRSAMAETRRFARQNSSSQRLARPFR